MSGQSIRRAMLVILDGFGVNPNGQHNAILKAKMPRLDEYFTRYPSVNLEASGAAVGLPAGQMGNSEVGHITLGCGCIIRQDLVRIDDAIQDGSFYTNEKLLAAFENAKATQRPVHLLGLVSDGGVHSHLRHLRALLKMAAQANVVPLLHMITDGRDTAPVSAHKYLASISSELLLAGGKIATVIGRYYAMDRDQRWDRTHLAWNAIVSGQGRSCSSAEEAIQRALQEDETDEFILPSVINSYKGVQAGDQFIFFNFRNDRPRQLAAALSKVGPFKGFERPGYAGVNLTTMTEFDAEIAAAVAFRSEHPHTTLSTVISEYGLKQFHCAETEKYPHVTFFFNGGCEKPVEGEERVMVPSPKVATYDMKPEMSAPEVASAVIEALNDPDFAFIVVNFANGDMVGHTANEPAIIAALEAMDREVGRILDVAVEKDVSVLLTADHGNCDEVVDAKTGEPHTQHTTHPVPCLIVSRDTELELKAGEGLSSVAPTLLKLMGLPIPAEMTGPILY